MYEQIDKKFLQIFHMKISVVNHIFSTLTREFHIQEKHNTGKKNNKYRNNFITLVKFNSFSSTSQNKVFKITHIIDLNNLKQLSR